MAFYFLTFATAAWGYVYFALLTYEITTKWFNSYALIAWLAEILRREPEVRSILVALAVTLVCTYQLLGPIPLFIEMI